MKQKIGFLKGMRSDLSPTKQDPNSYYHALNKSVISDISNSTGTITDEIGNKLVGDIIDILGISSNYSVIKLDSVRDYLVVFLKGTSGTDRIDLFTYDNTTESISHYKNVYSGSLNLGYSIDTVYRYRDTAYCKVYWSDGINQLRSINIFDTNSASIPLELLDIIPKVAITQPTISSVTSDGMYQSGVVQYAYQLYNLDGAETTFSPISDRVLLSTSSYSAPTSEVFKGSKPEENTGKSVTVTISGIDTNFTYIKLAAIHYSDISQQPIINIVEERSIRGESTISIKDTGNTVLDVYTPEEFSSVGGRFIIPKTITTKDNYLIAGNIKEKYFDLDDYNGAYWDARAYRFKNIGGSTLARVQDSGGTFYYINSSFQISGEDVPKEHDVIQTKNTQRNILATSFMYQTNLTTKGGEGPNIKYEFITTPKKIDTAIANTADPQVDEVFKIKEGYGYTGYANPLSPSYYGYMRDEMYRFGIVFVDEYGRHSFVKWIADIKTPSNIEKPILSVVGDEIRANVLGIKFTVSNVPSGLRWFIVRAKRGTSDKTNLFQGFVDFIKKHTNGDDSYFLKFLSTSARDITLYKTTDYVSDVLITLSSPEISYNSMDIGNYTQADKLNFVEAYKGYRISTDAGDANDILIGEKYYDSSSLSCTDGEISGGGFIKTSPNDIATIPNSDGSYAFANQTITFDVGEYIGIGGSSVIYSLDTGLTITGNTVTDYETLVFNHERNSSAIYGGNTYNAKLASLYIKTGDLKFGNNFANVYNGDTIIAMYENLSFSANPKPGKNLDGSRRIKIVPLETTVNLPYTNGFTITRDHNAFDYPFIQETKAKGFEWFGDSYSESYEDYYQYNKVYSRDSDVKIYSGKPYNFRALENLDYRIINSERTSSINVTDPWTKFLYTSVQDINSHYGAINKLIVFREKLLAFQDKALAQIGFNDREVQQSTSGSALTLGTSDRLTYHTYISNSSGAYHKDSIIDTGSALYYFDGNNKKIMSISEGLQSLTDVLDMTVAFKSINYNEANITDEVFENDKGIVAGFNENLRKVFFSIYTGDSFKTYSFNEKLQAFESEHSWASKIYTNHKNNLILENTAKLYIADKGYPLVFFDTLHNSSITIVSNSAEYKHVLTNLEFNAFLKDKSDNTYSVDYFPNSNITDININNSYQTKNHRIIPQSNIRRRFKTWRYQAPRDNYNNRFLDYFHMIEIVNKPSLDTNGDFKNIYLCLDDINIYYLIPLL